jgi:GNAT superfamily N-acetyltransferase
VPSAGDIEISTDISRIDVQAVHAFLTSSYWAKDRSIETVETSLKNSLCFGAYIAGKQVAFGRIVTDYSTFAYLVDIFVLPAHRGQGISKKLLSAMIAYPRLQGVGMLLRTRDAHGLYAQFGFKPPTDPSMLMVMLNVPKAAGSFLLHTSFDEWQAIRRD